MREFFLHNSQIPILNQSVRFQLYKKECHLLSDKLESMEISTPEGFNDKPEGGFFSGVNFVISIELNID